MKKNVKKEGFALAQPKQENSTILYDEACFDNLSTYSKPELIDLYKEDYRWHSNRIDELNRENTSLRAKLYRAEAKALNLRARAIECEIEEDYLEEDTRY